MRSRTLAAAVAISLAGCAAESSYQRALPPLPAGWRAATAEGAVPPSADWWQAFGDPVLADLQARAAAANPDLQIALARLLAVADGIAIAKAKQRPQITIGASPVDAINASASGRQRDAAVYGLAISARYELDFWGRLAQGVNAATAAREASAFDAGTVRISLQKQVAVSYFAIRAFDELIDLQRQRADLSRQLLQLTHLRVAAGLSSRTAASAASAAIDEADARLGALNHERAQSLLGLALLLGETPESLDLPAAALTTTVRQPPPVGALPSALIEQRPDIRAAEQRLVEAHADVAATRAALLPQFALVAEVGLVSGPLRRLVAGSKGVVGIGPDISYPLYDGGTRRAEVDASDQARVIAVAEYRKTILAALADVERALLDRQAAEAQTSLLGRALARAQDDSNGLQARLAAGYASGFERLTAQDGALEQQAARVDNYKSRLIAALDLFAALGGAWDPDTLPTAAAGRGTAAGLTP